MKTIDLPLALDQALAEFIANEYFQGELELIASTEVCVLHLEAHRNGKKTVVFLEDGGGIGSVRFKRVRGENGYRYEVDSKNLGHLVTGPDFGQGRMYRVAKWPPEELQTK